MEAQMPTLTTGVADSVEPPWPSRRAHFRLVPGSSASLAPDSRSRVAVMWPQSPNFFLYKSTLCNALDDSFDRLSLHFVFFCFFRSRRACPPTSAFSVGLCIGAQHRYNIYREVGATDIPIYRGNIGSRAKRGGGAKNGPPAGEGKKNHAIWLHFPSKSGNNIDYRIVE